MNRVIDWAAGRARMVLAFIALSLAAGGIAYVNLPKEGEPGIEIPALFISVPFPGISANDSEQLLVRPMEAALAGLDGLRTMSSTAAEGYAGIALEFEFGWNKTEVLADVRDAMQRAEAQFPDGADSYSINEINFSEFPILVVNLSGAVPERTLIGLAEDLEDRIGALDAVLEARLTGQREEILLVEIDPLRLEAYNVSASELVSVVRNNNLLIAAGEVATPTGAFAVKIPGTLDGIADVYALPVRSEGDRVVTMGDLATIRLAFADQTSLARLDGTPTVAIQVVKRRGFNIIDTAALVRATVAEEVALWPAELREAVSITYSGDQSVGVAAMVRQLEGSVLTAVALVMIVVLGTLGPRSAILVGFSIPTTFLLTFALMGVMGLTISNIVMFGLILAVGMLVDGGIVVVEYADKRMTERGEGPMRAYTEAAKRMFWPIVTSTATTLCAFLPMLFWPGVPGQFMGMLPVTLIFVLTASILVALIYTPVLGGVVGRIGRRFERMSEGLRRRLPGIVRAALVPPVLALVFVGAMLTLNPGYLSGAARPPAGLSEALPGMALFFAGAMLAVVVLGALRGERRPRRIAPGYRRNAFGWIMRAIVGNPVMPLVVVAAVAFGVVSVIAAYGRNNAGVEFFVEIEPEQAIVYVQARGNLSLGEKDALVRMVEDRVAGDPGVRSAFTSVGSSGGGGGFGATAPSDRIGQVQLEFVPWDERRAEARRLGLDPADLAPRAVIARIEAAIADIPGIRTSITSQQGGPGSATPLELRLSGPDWEDLVAATVTVREAFAATPGVVDVKDTLPLPGIDWRIDVDVAQAARFGADVATVGAMVQLVTNGVLLDRIRLPGSDDEVDIRVRVPEGDRLLSTLDGLKVRTAVGLVPLSNFVTRTAVPEVAEIARVDRERVFDISASVAPDLVRILDSRDGSERFLTAAEAAADPAIAAGLADGHLQRIPVTANERIAALTEWLGTADLPESVTWEWTGDQEEQAESQGFLIQAFAGALGLMFIILLAQFNSFYNAVLVLTAVVLSTTGVLVGMLVMDQTFSIIMTGTGIVALAGIVVNNNIILIDTYQEYSAYMPRTEAIARTAQDRLRPVFLTTVTTIAGLLPMMFGVSFDFVNGGYTVDSPSALWWKQLATAVVFGLAISSVLTLVVTPALLALRVWFTTYVLWIARALARLSLGRSSRAARDWALAREARALRAPILLWEPDPVAEDRGRRDAPPANWPLRAAE